MKMYRTTYNLEIQEKEIEKTTEANCKKASKCRHEKGLRSCYGCADEATCFIQKRIETARALMY